MLFSSYIFLSFFLPLALGCYYVVPSRWRNAVLLILSCVFYSWGDIECLGILLGIVVVNYLGALVIDGIDHRWRAWRKAVLMLFVLVNVGVLFYFKYLDFVLGDVFAVFGFEWTLRKIVMPLGISFYTFQGMSYLIDVYRRDVPAQKNLLTLALFISYFPQLVAGPILKYHDICRQLENRRENLELFAYGVRRFIMGLAKKVLIANTMGSIADAVFGAPVANFDTLTAWGGAVGYSLQLYFDFSGYSDMAIGLGAMFGFRFKENFNYPYISSSITEFWRRWHISLSTWFKEYLYIPLGGNRVSKGRNLLNLAIVFLVTGIWHGAAWTFVVWGSFHGFFILLEKLIGFSKKVPSKMALRLFGHVYVILVVVFGWVLFRAPSLSYALEYVRNMLGLISVKPIYDTSYYFSHLNLFAMSGAILLSAGVFKNVVAKCCLADKANFLFDVWLIFILFLSMAFLAGSSYNPFIYFRF